MSMDDTLVTDLLTACGMVPVGDPPRVTVDVLGRAVHAVFRKEDRQVVIEASVTTSTPPSAAVLEEASLHAPGDTWITHHDDHVTARRTLVEPDAGQFFAALHELGKQVVALAPHGPSIEPEPAPVPPAPPVVPAAAAAPSSTVSTGTATDGDSWSFVDAPTPLHRGTQQRRRRRHAHAGSLVPGAAPRPRMDLGRAPVRCPGCGRTIAGESGVSDPTPPAHPGRPSAPPPGQVPPAPAAGPQPAGRGPNRTPLLVAAVVVVLALIAGGVLLYVNSDEAEAGEVFLEPAADVGQDPFGTDLTGEALAVTTTTASTATTAAGRAQATPSVSGGQPGLYGGTRNKAVCDPQQQAAFLASNPQIAQAFVDALNADPTLRWSGGSTVSVAQIGDYLAELTPLTLTGDTRVTNHGLRNGRPTARPAVLQAGTAVLVDQFGTPRVKCNCGNPLTAPKPLPVRPVYTGPQWPGFAPTTIVVITQVTVQIDVFVIVDVNTGEEFTRPAGTTGAEDGDVPESTPSPPVSTPPATSPPATSPPATAAPTPPSGDVGAWCAKWQGYIDEYGDVDPTTPELVSIFEDLASSAPAEIAPAMNTIVAAANDALARGLDEIDESTYPGVDGAIDSLLVYLGTNCPSLLD